MTIHRFAVVITRAEGLKVSMSIAQVKEVLRIVNVHLGGLVYKAIRAL